MFDPNYSKNRVVVLTGFAAAVVAMSLMPVVISYFYLSKAVKVVVLYNCSNWFA